MDAGRGDFQHAARLAEIANRVFKHRQAIAALVLFARPTRMMRRIDVPFRVRHQPEDSARFVAQASDIALSTIRIQRIGQQAGCGERHILRTAIARLIVTERQLPLSFSVSVACGSSARSGSKMPDLIRI